MHSAAFLKAYVTACKLMYSFALHLFRIELGGFGVLLDTLNTGPSLLLRGNNARSSFQCQDFIHDDMFQVLITPLKSISEIANHRN